MCSDVRSGSVAISDALCPAVGRVADWKRARFEPADRWLRHAIGAGEIGLRSAITKVLDGLALLVRCQDSGRIRSRSNSASPQNLQRAVREWCWCAPCWALDLWHCLL